MKKTASKKTPPKKPRHKKPTPIRAAPEPAPEPQLVCGFCGRKEADAVLMIIPSGKRAPCICDYCIEAGQGQLNNAVRNNKAKEQGDAAFEAEVQKRLADKK